MGVCREWQAAKTAGYGVKWDRELKRVVLVHRWVVAQMLGWEAIKGKVIMHLCDNPACYLYEHLQVGTQQENMQDAENKGRTHGEFVRHLTCRRGHAFTEANTYINPDGDRECRRCRADASARSYRKRRSSWAS